MVMTWVFKGQSIPLSFTAIARNTLLIILFFYLWKVKPSRDVLEKYIIGFGFLYIILWSYAMMKIPEVVFGDMGEDGNFDESRGMIRINFVGRGNLIFAFFLCLNKFKETQLKKWFLLVILFFVFNVFQVTRQLILWPMIVGLLYLLWNKKKWCFLAVMAAFALYLFIPTVKFSDDSVIGSMINLTEQQGKDQKRGEDDVRIREYKYFFTEWHNNPVTFLLGTGQPHGASEFGLWYQYKVEKGQKFYLSDVGYASMFALYGLMGLLLWGVLYLKGAFFRVSESLAYTRMWMFFMILANIAANWYEKPDFLIPTLICFYLMGQNKINTKTNKYSYEIQYHNPRL
ncbi:MAG: O-antigen ligase family protein [Bacteroides sp.]|nr:O-antigen ligase family protein [Bacteroides sp.]